MEAEGHPGKEPDFGVGRFDEAVAEAVVDGGPDRGQVGADAAAEGGEFGDAAAGGPGQPAVQRVAGFAAVEFQGGAQAFFEEVGAVEEGVGFLDPGEFGLLAVREIFRVFPQRVAGPPQVPGTARGQPQDPAASAGRP